MADELQAISGGIARDQLCRYRTNSARELWQTLLDHELTQKIADSLPNKVAYELSQNVSGGNTGEQIHVLQPKLAFTKFEEIVPPPGLSTKASAAIEPNEIYDPSRLSTPQVDVHDVSAPPGLPNLLQHGFENETFGKDHWIKQGHQQQGEQQQLHQQLLLATATQTPNFCTFCGMAVAPMHAGTKFCAYCGNKHAQCNAQCEWDGYSETKLFPQSSLHVQLEAGIPARLNFPNYALAPRGHDWGSVCYV